VLRIRWLICLAAILVLGLAIAIPAACEGTDAGSFAREGIGARAFGLGGSFVALADDAFTGLWNPAGLVSLADVAVGAMYTDKFGLGIRYQAVSAAAHYAGFAGGMTFISSTVSGIPFTGGDGSGVFSDTQGLILVSGSVELLRVLPFLSDGLLSTVALGTSLRLYTHRLLEGRARGIGLDLGGLGRCEFGWGEISVGVVSHDIGGTTLHWRGTDHNPSNEVPGLNQLGVAVSFLDGKALVSSQMDIAFTHPDLNQFRLGAEVWVVDQFGVRAGLSYGGGRGFIVSAGGSIRWRGMTIDYAYVPHSALGGSHILSFSTDFNGLWKGGEEVDEPEIPEETQE